MARAHFVKKAAKDHPEAGIKKGESYWWWKFMVGGRGGPKHYSKTQPKASQLTQSAYLSALADIQDQIGALTADASLESDVGDIASNLRELANEQQEKLDGMPDSLQQGPTGELLQERADACNNAADELEGMDFDADSRDKGETEEDYWAGKLEEVQAVSLD